MEEEGPKLARKAVPFIGVPESRAFRIFWLFTD
jgi:hypothetical protein